ncbi:hypothetical protein [Vibrio sp. HN007]|uniref:hypothetical protein n=1 Tax=Vibrio iocasae TaxID=3098914 RepID=UPI0035D4BDBD
MSLSKQLTLIGALCAYLVGAGFATGQETVQFYSGWGSVWASITVGVISFLMMFATYSAYAYAGRNHEIRDVSGIFRFYAGTEIGKLFELFAWMFNGCAYVFMVSGFGSVLLQQWAVPLEVGCALAVILSVTTAATGLTRMTKVIGKLGPFLILFTLFIGIVSSQEYYPRIAEGNAIIASGKVEVVRAGANLVLSGLSYGGVCILLVSAMVGRVGVELRSYKVRYTNIILGVTAFAIPFVNIVMGLNHIGNIEEASQVPIPNLLLANHIFGSVGDLFSIIILLAIYSSLCPILWTCVSMGVRDEKSNAYKLSCVCIGVLVYIVTLYIPYQTLLNVILTYCGLAGFLVFSVITVRFLLIKYSDKNNTPIG